MKINYTMRTLERFFMCLSGEFGYVNSPICPTMGIYEKISHNLWQINYCDENSIKT